MKRILLLVIIVLFSSLSISQEDQAQSVIATDDVRPFMDNLGNRFVYAFFGREALVFLLDDPEHKRVASEIDKNVLDAAAAPFNMKLAGFYVGSLFSVLSFYYLGYFFLRTVYKGLELAWMTQKLGSLPMRQGEFRQFSLRITLIGGLVFISFGTLNAFQIGVLKFFYEASTLTDKAAVSLVENRYEVVPTLTIPRADSKQKDMLAILSYNTCVALAGGDPNDRNVKFNRDRLSGGLFASVSSGDCHLEIELALNNEMDEQIQALYERQGESVESGIYLEAQRQVYTSLITDLFSQANRYGRFLSNDGDDRLYIDREPEKMAPWGNFRYGNGGDSWERSCEAFLLNNFGNDDIGQFDRQAYAFHASRCMSYRINEELLYPTYYGDIEEFLDLGVLRHRNLMMCEEDLATLDPNGSVMTNVSTNPFASDEDRTQINIEACALRACEQSALTNGSLYMCANAVSLVQKRQRDERVVNQGNMLMGAYIFDLFTAPVEFKSGRDLFNGFSVTFSEDGVDIPSSVDLEDMFLEVNIPSIEDKASLNSEIHLRSVYSSLVFKDVSAFMRGEPKSLNVFMSSISPFERLATCVQDPLGVSNGYACGNVPQEMNKMGLDLINFAVDAKMAMVLAQIMNEVRKRMMANTGGTVLAAPTGAKDLILKFGTLMGMSANTLSEVFDVTTSPLNNPFDTRLTPIETTDVLLSDAMGMIIIGALSTNGTMAMLLDGAIAFVMLAGLFLGVILPMMPMVLFIIALSMAFFLLFKVMIIGPIKLIDLAFEDDANVLTQKAEMLLGDLVAMIIKIPLTFIGLVVAWLLANATLSAIMKELTLSSTMNMAAGSSTTGFVDAIIVSTISIILLYFFFATVISIIEGMYSFVVKFAMGEQGADPFNSEKAGLSWMETKQSFRNMVAVRI